jgi:tetratricopeptide (TPR) repeat protein
MIRRAERHESARDRARVAAELLEEARLLTETAFQAASGTEPAAQSNEGATGNGNGSGRARRNGKLAVAPSLADHSGAERALAALDAALAAQPDSVSLLLDRAKQLVVLGRYAPARADLERALALDPENLTVRSALGIVLLRKGLWASAVPHLRTVVEVESWSPTAWFYLGDALNHVDDLDGALAAFSRAAELDPRHAKALYSQGVVLDRMRRPDDAARMYRRSREVASR